jgi:hypothetical protein
VAASSETLRASANDPAHSRSITCAPNERAISTVPSVEPVSTTMISSTASFAAASDRGSISRSSLTIMQRLRRRPVCGLARFTSSRAR